MFGHPPRRGNLDFSWSGEVNSGHEAEGDGVLEWAEVNDGRKPVSVYSGEMKAGGVVALAFRCTAADRNTAGSGAIT